MPLVLTALTSLSMSTSISAIADVFINETPSARYLGMPDYAPGQLLIASFEARDSRNFDFADKPQRNVNVNQFGNDAPLPSFSARHIRRHEPTQRELIRTDIELSPEGFRVRQAVQGDRHREMLQDFVNNEAWLIDRKRRIAHRLPVEDDADSESLHPGDGASFLSQSPCGKLLSAVHEGQGVWRGRRVDTWYCKDAENVTQTIEFMDQIYGIVVLRRTATEQTDELINLQEREFPKDYFRPNLEYRVVSRQEFFGGVPEIKRYEE